MLMVCVIVYFQKIIKQSTESINVFMEHLTQEILRLLSSEVSKAKHSLQFCVKKEKNYKYKLMEVKN